MLDKLNALLILLGRTVTTRDLYFSNHPLVEKLEKSFLTQLHSFCEEYEQNVLFVGIVEGNMVYDGKNLVGPSLVGNQLIRFADKLHCGGISFTKELSQQEFRSFLTLTAEMPQPPASLTQARQLLRQHNITGIQLAKPYKKTQAPLVKDEAKIWQGEDSEGSMYSSSLLYQALFNAVTQAHSNVIRGRKLDINHTRAVSEYMLHFSRFRFSDLMQHIHYPDYESYIIGHSVRVASLAVYIAHAFQWSEEAILSVGTAGLLHDIGKSKIPREILYKTGKLSEEEFDEIKKHPQYGVEILLKEPETTPIEIAVTWGHHIRQDGGGYPAQPEWATRHPITQLIQICDVFEAITAIRPYKPVLFPQMAYSIMLSDKGCLHHGLLCAFIKAVGLYPVGNRVRLSNGFLATVTESSDSIDKPKIQLTHDSSENPLPKEKQSTVDLSKKNKHNLSIVEMLLPISENMPF